MPPVILPQTPGLWGHRPLQVFLWARGFSKFSSQILTVAVGWQIYDMTSSALALGMAGLVQFLPTAILVFVAGHVSDRYDRRRLMQLCQLIEALTALFLAWGSYEGWLTVPQIFAAVALFGVAAAFESPSTAALLPAVAPTGMLQKATALSTGVFQLAAITGPAVGGLSYGVSAALPYAIMAGFWATAAILNGQIKIERSVSARESPTPGALFAGLHFVRNNPAILGTISLDLFAVLLGGASALLPIYARDILQTGPWGLGMLRGAQAVGALLMTGFLSRHAIIDRVGMRMFQAVIVFGVATVIFGLSHTLWLSVLALAVMGAADTISVVIRVSLVQLKTPDEMRGRVGAVNFLFINASNQLGEFESGMMAALLGAVPAVVFGGIGTIAVALLWMKLFPALRDLTRLE
ncbi:MFS transporter [Hyphomicrobium sp.]|uniref:MFS transporter n=1 Tax=Hyphomicrobium sp. TaxID=82 RepID=UPI001D59D071|nr:MFS transporter [Hyphomicrobium sp.]MBY0559356.1 MFS transporter [Hyphomicrobium sp.]